MDPEIEKGINLILKEWQERGQVSINTCTPEAMRRAIPTAKALGLIQKNPAKSYDLTNKGLKAIKLGGILQYCEDLESNDNKDKLIKNLTIKQLERIILQAKYWWLPLLISGVIGFIAGNFELILKWFN